LGSSVEPAIGSILQSAQEVCEFQFSSSSKGESAAATAQQA
jgi:hypothetical protein